MNGNCKYGMGNMSRQADKQQAASKWANRQQKAYKQAGVSTTRQYK